MFSEGIDKKIDLRDRVDLLLNNINTSIEEIYKEIGDLEEESRVSIVLENAMSGETKTMMLGFSDRSLISDESERVIVKDGKLYVDTTLENADKDSIRLEPYNFSSISAVMRSRESLSLAKIEFINDLGVGFYPEQDKDIINSDIRFRIEGTSDIDIDRNIDLIIDRKDNSEFNQVEILLEKAHIVSLYTSDTGQTYTKRTNRAQYIKDSLIQIEATTDRFIKIVFNKIKFDQIKNGNNIYSIIVNSLSILRTTFTGESLLITNPLEVTGSYSKLAISVCDSITEGQKALLSYYVSINGKGWEPIRPSGRYKGDELSKSSIINVNSMISNKFILLKDKIEGIDTEEYTLALPEDFIRSNILRVFSDNITDSALDWDNSRGIYTAVGVLYEEKTIDFGPNEISINGKWVSGEVTLTPDIYRIKINSTSYANVILNRQNSVIDIGNGEYSVESDNGSVRTVF
ncbi:hypothetical protein N9242_07315, partial [Vicingaceae bacterium]|nr:hypothetical protein [Vicingaceae bacterium]